MQDQPRFTNADEFRRLFPRASKATIEANVGLPPAKPEHHKETALGKAVSGKEKGMARITVRYRGCFVRLQDPENFCASTKDCTDGLRRCGLIYDDSPEHIELITTQERVKTFDEQRLEIEIEYPI